MVQHYIHSILMGDRSVIDRAKYAPPDFLSELARNWPAMSPVSREIAIRMLEKIDSPQGAAFLLKATVDPSSQVANGAARAFSTQSHPPSGDSILALIPARQSPFVRGCLYLAAGKAACGLEALRRFAATEADPAAALDAQAAMVFREGVPERLAFFERVRKAASDEVRAISQHLFYINDPALAKGMLPWLNNTTGVMRIGFDGPGGYRQARMCDFAIWNGAKLGLATGAGTSISNYDPNHISRVRKIYAALPDPQPDLA
jgi:aromatic ring-cleaving dioxygenase